MKEFSFYLTTKRVKQQPPDTEQATAMSLAAQKRFAFAKRFAVSEDPTFVLENAYESVREMIDALLIMKGFKSYSHEASVAYLQETNCEGALIALLNRLRERRNGIKYYGKSAKKEDAEKAIRVCKALFTTLQQHLKAGGETG